MQGNDRDAVTRLGVAARIDAGAADRLGRRHEPVSGAFAHERHVAGAQGAFQHVQHVVLGDRMPRCETDGSLHARIDGVTRAENVAEDDFGDGDNRRVFEIELVTLAAAGGRHRRGRLDGCASVIARRAWAAGGSGVAWSAAIGILASDEFYNDAVAGLASMTG